MDKQENHQSLIPSTASSQNYQQKIFQAIKEQTGICNVIIVPEAIMHLCPDLQTAVMISHLVYWADRGGREDGYIWKSLREWREETSLNRYQVDKSSAWLMQHGLLEVRKGMACGHPTLHYRINQEAVLHAVNNICRTQQMEMTKSANARCRNRQIHNREYLAETSSEISKNEKGSSRKRSERAISFKAFLKEAKSKEWLVDQNAVEVVNFFLKKYRENRGEQHPNLRISQWLHLLSTILDCGGLGSGDFMFVDHEVIIDQYFKTYFENCDYRIMHYNTDGVKYHRLCEVSK